MSRDNLRSALLGIGIAAVGVVMSDALARMTARALREPPARRRPAAGAS
ncbi:hypothetical protein ACFFX1_52435 [Dactylosporangium sucinum]|uniref:Uncharacterized protein n=1 Tax=Dactylosporangium sucinum TaxID=1424081 RepID=A0A917X6U7_9ACTN|nr:hypothetical protein [Dactylosporangium sucinum]GGM77237.1 hypothetical protein GCM10007977_093420 [Dactylosporangium sucinum]GGM77921.1 hypothetical protein GCM10007977_094270 [Dactylosporangium sucinum]